MLKVCFVGGKQLGEKAYPLFKKYPFIEQKSPYRADYVFNLFGDKIFKKTILDSLTYGAINFHYGKLPQYRGRFIVSHMINNGDKEACITSHWIDEGIDTGDIIYEKWIQITNTDTAYSLYNKCTNKALELFKKVMDNIVKGNELPRKKQIALSTGRYYHNIPLNNDEINLNVGTEVIKRFIRATTFPPFYPYIKIHGKKYYVKDSSLDTKL
jgi:methionyl-tRNA formyltransferase